MSSVEHIEFLKEKTKSVVLRAAPLGISDMRLTLKLVDLGATKDETHLVIDSLIAEGTIERDSMNYFTYCGYLA